jgi:hypothetical protein
MKTGRDHLIVWLFAIVPIGLALGLAAIGGLSVLLR